MLVGGKIFFPFSALWTFDDVVLQLITFCNEYYMQTKWEFLECSTSWAQSLWFLTDTWRISRRMYELPWLDLNGWMVAWFVGWAWFIHAISLLFSWKGVCLLFVFTTTHHPDLRVDNQTAKGMMFQDSHIHILLHKGQPINPMPKQVHTCTLLTGESKTVVKKTLVSLYLYTRPSRLPLESE